MSSLRIGILGQPCIDEIIGPDGLVRSRSLGGILYSYAAMELLMRGTTGEHFVPLTFLSTPDRPLLSPYFEQLSHCNHGEGLWETAELTNRVQLVYSNHSERTEYCPTILPSLTLEQLTPELLSSLDGLFVNMISGYDVDLDVLESSLNSARRRPFVHLDIHALVLGSLSRQQGGVGEGRTPRGVANWRRWLDLADSVQMNELEARWFGDPEVTSFDALISEVHSAQSHRPSLLILTRAERGATLFDLATNLESHAIPEPVLVIEPTGSGDVFGAAFIYSILTGHSPKDALQNAVRLASWNTTLAHLTDILE